MSISTESLYLLSIRWFFQWLSPAESVTATFSADGPFDRNRGQDSGRLRCIEYKFWQLSWMQCSWLKVTKLLWGSVSWLPFSLWPPKLMLVFNVNDIFDRRLCVNPELVVSPIQAIVTISLSNILDTYLLDILLWLYSKCLVLRHTVSFFSSPLSNQWRPAVFPQL